MVGSMVTNIHGLRLVNWSYCNIANCMVIEYSDCYATARCTWKYTSICYCVIYAMFISQWLPHRFPSLPGSGVEIIHVYILESLRTVFV